MSTWPVGSGVLIEDGTAYFAAGIVNYDGTYIYALDAKTGRIKWQNNHSGHLDPQARTGVSVQGHMLSHDGKLYLAGGNAVSPAVYDKTDGRCLNDPGPLEAYASRSPRGWELSLVGDEVFVFGQPYYGHPEYDVTTKSVFDKVFLMFSGDRLVVWSSNQRFYGGTVRKEILCFQNLDKRFLEETMSEPDNGFRLPWWEFSIPDDPSWSHRRDDCNAIAVCSNAVVIAGESEVVALNIEDGEMLWRQPIPAEPVPWGLAVDAQGRVIISLVDGSVVCFG
jgi:hypothetical protein